jgi:hypothetical protein
MKSGSEVPVGDGPCTDCGQENPFVWWTDNVFWNEVCRTGDDYIEPILCPTCFVKRVFSMGFRPTAMRIIPDWPWAEMERPASDEPGASRRDSDVATGAYHVVATGESER